jgi:hypothetical protein
MFKSGDLVSLYYMGFYAGSGIVCKGRKFSSGKLYYQVKIGFGEFKGQTIWQSQFELSK